MPWFPTFISRNVALSTSLDITLVLLDFLLTLCSTPSPILAGVKGRMHAGIDTFSPTIVKGFVIPYRVRVVLILGMQASLSPITLLAGTFGWRPEALSVFLPHKCSHHVNYERIGNSNCVLKQTMEKRYARYSIAVLLDITGDRHNERVAWSSPPRAPATFFSFARFLRGHFSLPAQLCSTLATRSLGFRPTSSSVDVVPRSALPIHCCTWW